MPTHSWWASKDVVHQVAKLMEEGGRVAVFHEAWIRCGWLRKVAHQSRLGQLLASHAVENGSQSRKREFARTRMHIEIETADQFPLI